MKSIEVTDDSFAPHKTEAAASVWQVERSPGHPVLGALSPSRAGDFTSCPLLYRYRTIDKLSTPPTLATAKGTLVHQVLEDVFDIPAHNRTLATAQTLVPSAWQKLINDLPEYEPLIAELGVEAWFEQVGTLLENYFSMEDPRYLEPAHREVRVECELPDGPVLRGVVDRVDIAPSAGVRIVDYKSGKSPGQRFEQKAMFQLRFYGLVVWRMTGEIPALLQLNYLGNGEFLRLQPTASELERFEDTLRALWRRIEENYTRQNWQPRTSALCRFCNFHELCPAQGGTLLPLPTIP